MTRELSGCAATAAHRLCFVCHRPVQKTPAGKICGHLDKAGRPCEGSWESYTLGVLR